MRLEEIERQTDKKENKSAVHFAVFVGFVLAGVMFGTISYCLMGENSIGRLSGYQDNFLEARRLDDFGKILLGSFGTMTAFLLALLLCGFSALGQPFTLCVLILRGMGLGTVLAELYKSLGKRGLLIAAAFVLPSAIVSSVVCALGAMSSVKMSNRFLSVAFSDKQTDGMKPEISGYLTKFFLLEAVLAAAAAVECLCTVLLSGKI